MDKDPLAGPSAREELISLAEAASLSGLTLKHLGLLARTGKLEARKIGRNWVITRGALQGYLDDAFQRSRDPYKGRR